jgi:hypothetical protein
MAALGPTSLKDAQTTVDEVTNNPEHEGLKAEFDTLIASLKNATAAEKIQLFSQFQGPLNLFVEYRLSVEMLEKEQMRLEAEALENAKADSSRERGLSKFMAKLRTNSPFARKRSISVRVDGRESPSLVTSAAAGLSKRIDLDHEEEVGFGGLSELRALSLPPRPAPSMATVAASASNSPTGRSSPVLGIPRPPNYPRKKSRSSSLLMQPSSRSTCMTPAAAVVSVSGRESPEDGLAPRIDPLLFVAHKKKPVPPTSPKPGSAPVSKPASRAESPTSP